MRKTITYVCLLILVVSCTAKNSKQDEFQARIQSNEYIAFTKEKALEVVRAGFNAGEGYDEVWIRDFNTFIELSAEVFDAEVLRENLLVFFRMQGEDGNIIDGFIPREQAEKLAYDYIYLDAEPRYAGHKNTVETDQESSLVQAVFKYVQLSGDRAFLNEMIAGKSVSERLEWAMEFLMNHRFNAEYGLIWGATTADWGDVQPEHDWGVFLTDDTHYALDIYDNAMFLIALDNLMNLIPETKREWGAIRNQLAKDVRKHLWDEEKQKFIPHIYLNGSPFPDDFNEDEVYYHGGTAVAIEAGLLSKDEIKVSLEKMLANVKASGAGSIGLTLYPPYPEGSFKNPSMYPYGYQNGGDWTWFGGRMIQQLIRYGFVEEAYEHLQPMVKRVKDNDGFYEWYTVKNEPKGSGTFRGSAGVLFKAIKMLDQYKPVQSQDVKYYKVDKVNTELSIDGNLDEEAWGHAEPTSNFVILGNNEEAARTVTWAKMLWDDQYLYLAFYSEDGKLWAEYAERDDPLYKEDVVEVYIDPDGDGEKYLEIEVSPLNTVFDLWLTKPRKLGGEGIVDWTMEGLKTACTYSGTLNENSDQDTAWICEMALPFKAMKFSADSTMFPPRAGDKWRFNLYRFDQALNNDPEGEASGWSQTNGGQHEPEKFGEIVFSDFSQ